MNHRGWGEGLAFEPHIHRQMGDDLELPVLICLLVTACWLADTLLCRYVHHAPGNAPISGDIYKPFANTKQIHFSLYGYVLSSLSRMNFN